MVVTHAGLRAVDEQTSHRARSPWRRRSRSPSCSSSSDQLARGGRRVSAGSSRSRPIIRDALHYAGVLAHQQGRSERGDRADRAEPRARAGPGRLAQQPRHRPAGARPAGRGGRRLPAARSRSIPTHANAHSNLGVLLRAHGQAGRGGSGVSDGDPARIPSTSTRTQPRRPAERPEADRRKRSPASARSITLQPEAPGGAQAAGAGALHARRGRQGGRDLRGVAGGGAGQSRSRGTCWPRAPAATCRRARRTTTSRRSSTASRRASRRSWRSSRTARRRWWRDAGGCGRRGRRRASTCSTPAAAPGCAARCVAPYARRLVGVDLSARHAGAGAARSRSTTSWCKVELTAYLRGRTGRVRRDRVGRHARLLRRARRGRRGRGAVRCGPAGCSSSRSRTRSDEAGAGLPPRDARPLHATRGRTSSGCWRDAGCSRTIARAELRMEAGVPVAGLVVARAGEADDRRRQSSGDVADRTST